MIKSFACKDTERIYQQQRPKKLRLDASLLKKALTKLRLLDMAETVYDLYNPPSNHFEALKGSRQGQSSIRIDRRWRICFRFSEGEAYDVEIVDYH